MRRSREAMRAGCMPTNFFFVTPVSERRNLGSSDFKPWSRNVGFGIETSDSVFMLEVELWSRNLGFESSELNI